MINMNLKSRVLRATTVFRARGIGQAEVAAAVGASQPQISRILKGEGIRATKLTEEVCLLAERLEWITAEAVCANKELVSALMDARDGSAERAKALAVVIRSPYIALGSFGVSLCPCNANHCA